MQAVSRRVSKFSTWIARVYLESNQCGPRGPQRHTTRLSFYMFWQWKGGLHQNHGRSVMTKWPTWWQWLRQRGKKLMSGVPGGTNMKQHRILPSCSITRLHPESFRSQRFPALKKMLQRNQKGQPKTSSVMMQDPLSLGLVGVVS